MTKEELRKELEEMIAHAAAARDCGDQIAQKLASDGDDYLYDTLQSIQDCEIEDPDEAVKMLEEFLV